MQKMSERPGVLSKGRRGFTLIEILISIGIFSIVLLAALKLQYNSLEADRVATMQMQGTVALRSHLEQSIASGYDNQKGFSSVAQGLIAYLNELTGKSGVGSGKDVNVELVGNSRIVYTFPVSEAGGSVLRKNGMTTEVNPSGTAIGTLTIYLRENDVPGDFTSWSTRYEDGTSNANSLAGVFDMNANQIYTDNFVTLYQATDARVSQSGLSCLPVRGQIQYFRTERDLADNRVAYTVVRNYIVNDSTVNSDDFGRDGSNTSNVGIE